MLKSAPEVAAMRQTIMTALAIACVGGLGCVDDAETPYGVCAAEAAKGNTKAASSACEDAVKKSPASKYGKLAADKLKEVQPALDKILATEKKAKDDADAKAAAEKRAAEDAAAKEAAAKKAAQDAEDAKCPKWMTICTTGRWPDGSERTTGAQYFDTKAACEQAGAIMGGVPCDPCACRR
jgi:membrane protein involved in colicin uptake